MILLQALDTVKEKISIKQEKRFVKKKKKKSSGEKFFREFQLKYT